MKAIFLVLKYGLAFFCLYIFHSAIRYILPSPYNEINSIFLVTFFLILERKLLTALSLGLTLSLVVELFSAHYFGLATGALLATIMVTQWALTTIFTNNRWYVMLIAFAASFFLYQCMQICLALIFDIFQKTSGTNLITPPTLLVSEVAINSLLFLIVYSFYFITVKRKWRYHLA